MLKTISTIGHSVSTLETFISYLKNGGVKQLVDVRSFPHSRHAPYFNIETLPGELKKEGIDYVHIPEVGGRRTANKKVPPQVNAGWKSKSFKNYADYMQTPEFEYGLSKLMEVAQREPSAMMCAESVPWRCHRSLITDALLIRGWDVKDIIQNQIKPANIHLFAKVDGTEITYPAYELESPVSLKNQNVDSIKGLHVTVDFDA